MNRTSFFKRFARDCRGFVSVEAVIVFPALLFIFGVGWTYFDAFRQQAVSQKANYVIGDMISRETASITPAYITNSQALLRHLTRAQGAEIDLRVTVVNYNADQAGWRVVWSETRGVQPRLQDADLPDMADRLPPGIEGEELILVETWDVFDPVFNVGLDMFQIKSYSFTRPRHAPQVVFDNA